MRNKLLMNRLMQLSNVHGVISITCSCKYTVVQVWQWNWPCCLASAVEALVRLLLLLCWRRPGDPSRWTCARIHRPSSSSTAMLDWDNSFRNVSTSSLLIRVILYVQTWASAWRSDQPRHHYRLTVARAFQQSVIGLLRSLHVRLQAGTTGALDAMYSVKARFTSITYNTLIRTETTKMFATRHVHRLKIYLKMFV